MYDASMTQREALADLLRSRGGHTSDELHNIASPTSNVLAKTVGRDCSSASRVSLSASMNERGPAPRRRCPDLRGRASRRHSL